MHDSVDPDDPAVELYCPNGCITGIGINRIRLLPASRRSTAFVTRQEDPVSGCS